tara:strand:- start:1153 stop:1350 length:198 start_codon:yes stop_codon:yes gene_type:complete
MQEERKILQGKSDEQARYVSVNEINRDYNGSPSRDKLALQKENDPFTANLISQLVNGTNIQQIVQ